MRRASPSPVLLAQDDFSPVAGHTPHGEKQNHDENHKALAFDRWCPDGCLACCKLQHGIPVCSVLHLLLFSSPRIIFPPSQGTPHTGGKTVAIRLGPVELGLGPIEIRLGPT